jgi:uncharacterized membrane protein
MTTPLETRIGRVLTAGRWVSTTLLAFGLLTLLLTPFTALALLLINAGLISLYATPVARVIAATIGFVESREWRFVAMTVAVLCVLVGSVVAGFYK